MLGIECTVSSVGMLVVIVSQIVLTMLAADLSEIMRQEWLTFLPMDGASILIVKIPEFWGPSIAVVPIYCTKQNATASGRGFGVGVAADSEDDEYNSALKPGGIVLTQQEVRPVHENLVFHVAPPAPGTRGEMLDPNTGKSYFVMMASRSGQHVGMPQLDVIMQAVAPGLTVGSDLPKKTGAESCGDLMLFDYPQMWVRYLAMISFSRLVLHGDPTLDDMRAQRRAAKRLMLICISISMVMKYGVNIIDMMSKTFGQQYMQIWNRSRTTFDRVLESLILHSMAIVFNLVLQISLCTMYFTFWRIDHFVMSFVPGTGLTIFLVGLVFMSVASVLDRCCGLMLSCSDTGLYTFWVLYCLWMTAVTIPMVGYCIFDLNYLYKVLVSGWLDNDGILTDRFVSSAKRASMVCGMFLIIAVIDVCLIIRMDIEKHGKAVCVAPSRDPLREVGSREVPI